MRLLLLTFGPRASPCSSSRSMAGDDDGTDLDVALEALMLDMELEVVESPLVLPSFDRHLALVPLQDEVVSPPPSLRRRLSIDWATKVSNSWVLPPGASSAVSSLTSRQKSDFRDQWCLRLLRHMPHLKAASYTVGLEPAALSSQLHTGHAWTVTDTTTCLSNLCIRNSHDCVHQYLVA